MDHECSGGPEKRPCPVVGMGASAGGLEAFQEFFEKMPVDTGMAFVIVQHLDPQHDTLMPELLARHTSMPVRLVTEDTPLASNQVFVLPPKLTLTIGDCMLRVSRPERMRGRRTPIDGFFRSLAEDQGDDSVGIIFSGTGTDGALGLKAIKEHGGLTLVQVPSSARYDSMPRAAIVSGAADQVLPVEEMPGRLIEHVRRLTTLRAGEAPAEAAGAIQRLEAELRAAKDQLRATLEELDSSNEELLSINEEVETINTELKKKVEELDRANGDLVNLFQSTRIATEQRDHLARIVESSQDAIIGKTLKGVVTSWNAGAERMYGYPAREMIGHPVDVLIPPERRSELAPIFAKLRQGQQVAPFETVRVRKNGLRFHVLLTVSPLFGSDDQVVGASAIARDITDRTQAENALREAARHKDEFLAMLGHELRNPLAPIRNCLYVLGTPNATAAQSRQALATLDRQVVHLTRLVDDLLDVSRISQGKILLRKERLDLAGLVRSTVEDHRGALLAAGLKLEVELPPGALWVNGDPTRLSQSVGNVLHNAMKFTDRGGLVRVHVKAEDGTAVVAVKDTGIGIEPEVLGRLFQPFSQAPPGIDRGRGGLGLGLALVRRLVELHGGLVEASSAGNGRGTEIRLLLPLVDAPAEAVEREDEPAAGQARRCLIIEDNVDAAETMALLLQLKGHEVAVAHSGQEGLDRARQLRPHVVLCDIGLPGALDGYAVARAFRDDPTMHSVRLIALTGYGQEEDQRRAREAGFDVHLTKPANPEILQRLLTE